jgi:membrane protein
MVGGHPVPLHYSPGYRVREFLRRLWEKSVEDEVLFMAGAVAFNVVIALVPLLILGIGLTGYIVSARFADPSEAVLALFEQMLPVAGDGLVLKEALRAPVAGLVELRTGFTVLGAVFFVWLSANLVASLRTALREVFDIGQRRGFLRGKLFDIQAVLIGVVLLALNVGVTLTIEAGVSQGGDARPGRLHAFLG